jgi:hypothetical protein
LNARPHYPSCGACCRGALDIKARNDPLLIIEG